jgi:putative ABC transport system permease protein
LLRVTLKNLLAKKFRLVLTSLAVVLGVAFMSGTFVLTDTIGQVFDELFADVNRGVDVAVRSRPAFDETAGGPGAEEVREPVSSAGGTSCTSTPPPDPGSLLEAICGVDGVRAAQGSIQGYALVAKIGKDGKPEDAVQPSGPPTIGVSWGDDRQLSQAFGGDGRAEVGHRPRGPNQVAIDQTTAEDAGISKAAVRRCANDGDCDGARAQIVFLQHEPAQFDVVGIFKFGSVGNLAGATLAAFDIPTAQEVMNRPGQFDVIRIAGDDGVSQTELRRRVVDAVRELPDQPRLEVLTGEQLAQDTSDQIRENLGFFNTFLLVFAIIALFVGAFIIYNTFSIIVAQRARELGLLRALGASGRQVTGSVAIEAFAVGLLSSVLGLGLGILVALGLQALMRAIGFGLPSGSLVVEPRTIIVSLIVGTVITFVSAISPARRAARVAPMAALRTDASLPSSGGRRFLIGGILGAVGLVLVVLTFAGVGESFPGGAIAAVGTGAALVFVGVAMLSPLVAVPTSRVLGWIPARLRGMAGVLARENASRNPRRTASTAAALMIGIAIVAVVAIFASSIKTTLSDVLESDVKAEFSLQSSGGGFVPVSPEAAAAIRDDSALDGAVVTEWRFGQFELDGSTEPLLGVNTNLNETLDIDPSAGSIAAWKADGGMLLFEDTYDDLPERVKRAGVLDVRFPDTPRGQTESVPIAGTFAEKGAIGNDYLLAMRDYQPHYATTDLGDVFVSVKLPAGMSEREGRRELERVLEPFPAVEVQDQQEFKEAQEAQIDQFINLIYVLLALAIGIALMGIINTLLLSVLERTRELGLLRAVGMTRKQMGRMVRYESLIIAVFGSLLGLVLGVAFGVAMVFALESEGITLGLPIGTLVIFVVIAGILGWIAGSWPARRAAHLDVLQAIESQ